MKQRSNERGQALVEYLLLIVFTIAILVAVAAKLFVPLKTWSKFYMGTYISCLLDYGVLPGSPKFTNTDCATQAAGLNTGLGGNNGNGGGNGNGNNGNNNNPGDKNGNNNSDGSSSADGKNSEKSQSGEVQRANQTARRNASRPAGPRGGRGRGGGQYTDSNGDKVEVGNDNVAREGGASRRNESLNVVGDGSDRRGGRGYRGEYAVERSIRVKGFAGKELNEEEKIVSTGEVTTIRTGMEAPGVKPKKIPIRSAAASDRKDAKDSESKFGIGGFFRIAIMLI